MTCWYFKQKNLGKFGINRSHFIQIYKPTDLQELQKKQATRQIDKVILHPKHVQKT